MYGGVFCVGASEMLMAKAVSKLASKTPGKESIAIESFANALRQVNIFYLYQRYTITHNTKDQLAVFFCL